MNNAILAYIGGFMPKFLAMNWDGKLFKLSQYRDDIRNMIPIIPYFWDSEVTFDLLVNIKKDKKKLDEYWDYEWELCDLDDKQVKPLVKDKVRVCNKGIRRRLDKGFP